MRVLIQNSVFYPNVIGGAEHSSWMLGLRLSARGHHVDAVATTGQHGRGDELASRILDGLSGRVFEAPAHGAMDVLDPDPARLPRRVVQHVANVRSSRWKGLIADLIDERRPDVIHTNTIVGMTGVVWDAAGAAGIPVVHTLRDYHQLCPRTTLLRSDGTECVDAPWPCRVYRRLKGRPTRHVTVVTAPSRFVLERHLEHGQFSEARPEVVPNAGPPPVQPRPEREERRAVHGVYLGQLDAHKGVDLLLDVLQTWYERRDAPLAFTFAGAGPLEARVRSFCSQWPEVRFAGFVDDDGKDHLLRSADFVVVPSRWNDNFPRVMLDAFRYALPVIGARRGGIPEVVEHESNGLIVEPTVDDVTAAMQRLVGDAGERLRFGHRAHEDAMRYQLDAQVEHFERLYQDVVGASVS